MRHRKKGRILGRSPSHRKAMLKNLASSLILTQGDTDPDLEPNSPKVKGRVITTLHKAKEVRPLVEKCVTIARKSLAAEEDARQFATDAKRGSETWLSWRKGEQWKKWNAAIAPAVAARRRALQLLGSKAAVRVLFDEVAPLMADREGGYTRILRLATPRLGDAGTRAILEFVGRNDRVQAKSERPAFQEGDEDSSGDEDIRDDAAESQAGAASADVDQDATAETAENEGGQKASAEKKSADES